MRSTLVFCSVGQPLPNVENHWRLAKRNDRLYTTVITNYRHESGFEPEKGSFDRCINKAGQKWALARDYIENNLGMIMETYEYIGIWDDDVQATPQALNNAIQKAYLIGAKLWQMSVTPDSDMHWPFLIHNPELEYSTTNFIEIMCPFYHTSLLPTMLEFWKSYDFNYGWGFDTVACDILQHDAKVIHTSQMYHPPAEGSKYSKPEAFIELRTCIGPAYRQFMSSKYGGQHATYDKGQHVIEEYKLKDV